MGGKMQVRIRKIFSEDEGPSGCNVKEQRRDEVGQDGPEGNSSVPEQPGVY